VITYPESQKWAIPVAISYGEAIEVRAPKNDELRVLLKKLGYRWDGNCWAKKLSYRTEPARDRVAELVNKLLTTGFAVDFDEQDIISAAISADFEPERTKWVSGFVSGKYIDFFALSWHGQNDWLYKMARSLPGSQWHASGKQVVVPSAAWREVADFADINGFSLSPKAQAMIAEKQSEIITRVSAKPAEEIKPVDKLAEILKTKHTGVLPDLVDDL
jgi:hypothetical protein